MLNLIKTEIEFNIKIILGSFLNNTMRVLLPNKI